MVVSELIEHLSHFNANAKVVVKHGSNQFVQDDDFFTIADVTQFDPTASSDTCIEMDAASDDCGQSMYSNDVVVYV